MYKQSVDPQVGILKQAVHYSNTSKILQLLQENPVRLAAVDEYGDTVLHFLLQSGKFSPQLVSTKVIEIMDTFINRAVDPSIINKFEETILDLAIAERLKDVVDYLLKRKTNVNVIDDYGNSIAHHFIKNSMARFRKLYKRSSHRSVYVETEIEDGSNFVEWLLSRGIDFDMTNKGGQSALHLAIEFNMQHILLPLLRNTPGVNFVRKRAKKNLLQSFLEASSPVICKCDRHSREWYECIDRSVSSKIFPPELPVKIVQILLDRGVPLDFDDEYEMTALHLAVCNQIEVPIFRMLLDRYANVSDDLTVTLFYEIFKHNARNEPYDGYLTILDKLIAKGVNLNSKDANGKSCLYYAVMCNDLKAIELMKKRGALRFSVLTNDGENPLYALAEQSLRMHSSRGPPSTVAKAIFDLLVSEGCDVSAKNFKGETPLHWAVRNFNSIFAEKLIAYGADVNCQDYEKGFCPLHEVIISQGSIQLMEMLLDNGANANSKSKKGRPLHLAMYAKGRRVLSTLLEYKAAVNARDRKGDTALAKALCFGRSEIDDTRSFEASLRALLEHGADINDASVARIPPHCIENLCSAILLQHWIKLRIANLPCANKYQTHIVMSKEYEQVRKDCLREIKMIKRTSIDTRTSLYGWLRMDPNRRHIYSHNEKLQKIVNSPTIQKQFPQYSTAILGNYRETLTRKSLLQPAKEAWLRLTEIHLPDICLEQIFVYLNTGDLFEMAEIVNES